MSFIEKIFGDLNKREVKKVNKIVEKVVALEDETASHYEIGRASCRERV